MAYSFSPKRFRHIHYRRLIGSLRYLLHTRPDLSYSVGVVSRFMEVPKESHLTAVKHIIRYIKGTIQNGLKYQSGGDGKLVGFSDSSFGTDIQDRRGTTGTVFYLSNNIVTWSSQKQRTVALSTCEAKFMAATTAVCLHGQNTPNEHPTRENRSFPH
ncbi:secreted RxLR effector protein 161-like [Helianthus annuus]|uniref:secreted RxLR effector protein 161-like n=1 Tax=Helianthus annuus TaxID=4232 RepID=UPI001652F6D9|nr:secreted RxLR effector protein 161-like [Helianthus annuus]